MIPSGSIGTAFTKTVEARFARLLRVFGASSGGDPDDRPSYGEHVFADMCILTC